MTGFAAALCGIAFCCLRLPMKPVKSLLVCAAACAALLSTSAQAWWNGDYKQRTKVTLNTSAQGIETHEALSGVLVPVRLHSGDFDFLGAKPDGSDLRVVAADDKTPLKFWVERFDATNELGVLWVQLPSVAPGTDKNTVYVYAGNDQATAEPGSPALQDGSTLAAITFAGKNGEPVADAAARLTPAANVAREPNGLIGVAGKLEGQALSWSGEALKAEAIGPYTASLWLKPATLDGTVLAQGPLQLTLSAGKLQASLNGVTLAGGQLPTSAWAQIAVTVGAGQFTLYVNGAQVAQAPLAASGEAIAGPLQVGQGLTGQVDQIEVAATVRSADWLRFSHAAQSAEAKLLMAVTQTADSADAEEGGGGGQSHFGILVHNLTGDAWVVIIILAIMFVIAAWVMYDKAVLVGRADKDNARFLRAFRDTADVLAVPVQGMVHSQLARLYSAGMRELVKREVGKQGAAPLSGASIDAVKAAIDADLVRENHTLNSRIVLLTIAISGGPFLGLPLQSPRR